MQKVKAEAAAAAEETRNDIEKLRELHSKRVEKLEALLLQEGQRLAEARREIGDGTCITKAYSSSPQGRTSWATTV